MIILSVSINDSSAWALMVGLALWSDISAHCKQVSGRGFVACRVDTEQKGRSEGLRCPELQGYLAAREHMMNEGLVKATSPQRIGL